MTSGVSQRRSTHRKLGHALPPMDKPGVRQAACGWELIWKSRLKCRLNSRIVCICDRLPGTSGGWIMDIRGFQVWLSAARGLTRAQRREALAVLSGRSEGEASKAAIELGVDEARRCPHCASEGAVSRGMARGLRRYQCKGCGRTFNALSGTPLSGLHHKERWLSFGASLAKGETVKASAARCDVAVRVDLEIEAKPEGCARAGTQGTAAGRQGEEARPLARAGAGSHGGRPERDDGQRGAAQGRCGGARGCPRSGGREGRPAGLRRRRELPTLRRRARG